MAWTAQAEKLFGWPLEEAIGRPLAELIIPPAYRQAHADGMRRYLETGKTAIIGRRIEIQAQHRSGHTFPVELTVHATRVDGRQLFSAAIRDITETRRAHERAEQLATVIEATPDFVGFAELSGQALYINRAGRDMVGMPRDAPLAGVSLQAKYPPRVLETVKAGIQHALEKGSWTGETAVLSAEGREIPTSQVIIAHRDEDDRPRYLSTIIRDISERYATEQALRELDRRKDDFLAMLAHELRNPLAPIGTAAQILRLPGLDAARIARASEVIVRQVAHMTELLDDLLDVSRVTRGLISIQPVPVDLGQAAAEAIEQARPLIELRRQRLAVHPPPQAITVEGDKTRLVQVFANLLNNAAKYTPERGAISVEIALDGPEVVVRVCDNGIGIAPETLPHIFELFTQARRSPDRSQGGLGLGLALVRSLVQLHGGSITARSAGEGQGSEFVVRLPVLSVGTPGAAPAPQDTGPQAARPLRVMVVDDNVDAAQTLATVIESAGHAVTVAYDARAALERAASVRPEVFLLDIGLPDIDGYELARRLRAQPGGGDAVLVALTGYGQREDIEQGRAAGFDHHLLKPAGIDEVFALLEAASRRAGDERTGT